MQGIIEDKNKYNGMMKGLGGSSQGAAGSALERQGNRSYNRAGSALNRNNSIARNLTGLSNEIMGQYRSTFSPLNNRIVNNAHIPIGSYVDQAAMASNVAADKAQGIAERRLMGMGINPNSGRFGGMQQKMALARAAAEAGARNKARMQGRQENFNRMMAAAQLGQNLPGMAMRAGLGGAGLIQNNARTHMALGDRRHDLAADEAELAEFMAWKEQQNNKPVVEEQPVDAGAGAGTNTGVDAGAGTTNNHQLPNNGLHRPYSDNPFETPPGVNDQVVELRNTQQPALQRSTPSIPKEQARNRIKQHIYSKLETGKGLYNRADMDNLYKNAGIDMVKFGNDVKKEFARNKLKEHILSKLETGKGLYNRADMDNLYKNADIDMVKFGNDVKKEHSLKQIAKSNSPEFKQMHSALMQ